VKVSWSYRAKMTFDDGSTDSLVVRFPSVAWWWLTALAVATPLARGRRVFQLKGGATARRLPDGSLEFREPE
jgi:hypothetical protein